ncbi:MAG: hypothetical protein DID92_2727743062 [Candidatus Nitrotoga sp. SPKER]|nr:MAG: hypothetical protein DID92_2727743062 [Candidatus Nitrotoga sp. SPKER]
MTRCEEVPHIRSLFRQFGSDEIKKLNLVETIRDIALCYLPDEIIARVPPPYFSDQIRASFEAKGFYLGWDLSVLGDTGVHAFCTAASHADDLTKGEKYAAQLLSHCAKALEEESVSDQLQQWILDAYSCLQVDEIENYVETLDKAKKQLNEKYANSLDEKAAQLKQDFDAAIDKAHASLKAKNFQLIGKLASLKSIIDASKPIAEAAT